MSQSTMKIFVLIGMIFFHILDDFHIQGILASMKQKSWWKENYPDEMYKYDYIVALLVHGFEWLCIISIPIVIYYYAIGIENITVNIETFLLAFILQFLLHSLIDYLKANQKLINLVSDQLFHLIQIITIFYLFIM